MKEAFLHYVWEHGLFDQANLTTSSGDPVQIFEPGVPNIHSGPDFLDARVGIGTINWRGNVEIHIHSCMWETHGHHTDPAYNSTVLHVCLIDDLPAKREDGSVVPTIALEGKIPHGLIDRYDQLSNTTDRIPCSSFLPKIDTDLIRLTLNETGKERLMEKAKVFRTLLEKHKGDWESAFFISLAAGFGGNINQLPFTMLAEKATYRLVRKYRHDRKKTEALLFGTGGFLRSFRRAPDNYTNELKATFQYLSHLHNIEPMEAHHWKFLRMRPANFPTVRLAQFCAVVADNEQLFPVIREDPDNAFDLLAAEISPYWKTHYLLNGKPVAGSKNLGDEMRNKIMINVIAPFIYLYGSQTGKPSYQKSALDLLYRTRPEKNHMITIFQNLGIQPMNAFETQALLQLFKKRCNFKGCLRCPIGLKLLKNET